MKKVVLIHTVKSVCNNFENWLRAAYPGELCVYNIFDSFLADNPDELGYVSAACKRKLFRDVMSALENEPDVIAVTCSAMTETVRQLRPFVEQPLIAIDENMIAKAVKRGKKIRVLATAASSAITTKATLLEEAERKGKSIQIDATDNIEAFEALQNGNRAAHDEMLKEQAKGILDYDIIILAQASMAHLKKDIEEITGIPVMISPAFCIREICTALDNLPLAKGVKKAVDHVALNVKSTPWFSKFFEDVFGMRVQDTDRDAEGKVRQLWLNYGLQFIRNDDEEDGGEENDAVAHIAIMVTDLNQALERAYAYPEVKQMPQGRNWLRLPENVCIEVLEE